MKGNLPAHVVPLVMINRYVKLCKQKLFNMFLLSDKMLLPYICVTTERFRKGCMQRSLDAFTKNEHFLRRARNCFRWLSNFA